MYELKIITSTVRPTRKGRAVADWIFDIAEKHPAFNVELLDLAIINLPFMDEPHHPRLKKYVHEHTWKWSKKIEHADAFIFVTAEYDYNYPAPLRNALEFLYSEWSYKAAGIVSYGGISSGTRAANGLKSDLSSFNMVPITEAVNFPFFQQNINEENRFLPGEVSIQAAQTMLNQLERWTKGLKIVREDT